jgi:tetratricopeptide (TPR) repeat protein
MTKGQEVAQRLIAIIVIMAMLGVMGIPLTVIFFFATVVYFVWRAVQRSEQQDVKNIFDFYIAANEILRDEEKRWYGFEVGHAIGEGERVLHLLPDPPPLVHFTLGALYQRAGDHEAAVEHLAYVTEDERSDERTRFHPSPELRRYVEVLRRIEREPAEAPQTMAAIRSLERARRTRAEAMLSDSRMRLGEAGKRGVIGAAKPQQMDATLHSLAGAKRQPPLSATAPPTAPSPIAEILHDIYEEEKKTA